MTASPPNASTGARLAPTAAAAVRAAIRLAGGREVCFVCTIGDDGVVRTARVVARGDVRGVLALPGCAQRGELLLHNHPSGELEPSEADLEVALRLHDGGVGFAITDNAASALYVVVEVPLRREAVRLSPEAIGNDLGPSGPIAAHHRRYEDRPSQRAMAATVAELYNRGGVGLLEAGTGVGKSLGYLLPALRWAAANGERTVVSTNTINLQEQLVGKDLPFLAEALHDQPVRFALLKGWRNYVCLLRLEQARAAGRTLFDDGGEGELAGIAAWAARTTDGSLADLASPPRPELWDEVAAEPDLCLRLKCPHFSACFLFKARQRAAQADVIVVNHHLLLSDVAVRRAQQNWDDAAVLPAYQRLIVDEGHHLEGAAAGHLGSTVTRRTLHRLLNRLERRGKGLLHALMQQLSSRRDLLSTASLDLVQARLAPAVQGAREKGGLVFDLLQTVVDAGGDPVMRLGPDFDTHPVWNAGLDAALDDLLAEIELLAEGLRMVRERLESEGARRGDEAVVPLLAEMRAVARRLQVAGDGLRRALRPGAERRGQEQVRWLEVSGGARDRNVGATVVPLDLAPILRDDLFARLETVIVTSATLATDDHFAFITRRLGLDVPELEPRTAIFASPFEYARQAILAIPTDFPAPNLDPGTHLSRVTAAAFDLADAADGGIFVLFTSHRDVRQAASDLRARGVDRRWPLLVHGEDGRDALLSRFRDSERAVLLGTASFWEGVDVPGHALRGLLIAKLPFRVPTEPMTAAQCEAIEQRGGDPFTDYMLPNAALRLKQGFGRLIRSGTDRGVVVLADSRVVSKRYGAGLIEALPPARQLSGTWHDILPAIRSFYAGR